MYAVSMIGYSAGLSASGSQKTSRESLRQLWAPLCVPQALAAAAPQPAC